MCDSAEAAPHKNCGLQSQPTHRISLQSLRLDEDLRRSHEESQREQDLITYDKHNFQTSGLKCKILEDVRDQLLFGLYFLFVSNLHVMFQMPLALCLCRAHCTSSRDAPGFRNVKTVPSSSKLHFRQIQCTGRTGRRHQYHQWMSINLICQRNCCSLAKRPNHSTLDSQFQYFALPSPKNDSETNPTSK